MAIVNRYPVAIYS